MLLIDAFLALRHAKHEYSDINSFLLHIFCIGVKIYLTLKIHGLAWVASGQLPNFLGAPQVLGTPATLQHCHSISMTALVSIVSQHTLCV